MTNQQTTTVDCGHDDEDTSIVLPLLLLDFRLMACCLQFYRIARCHIHNERRCTSTIGCKACISLTFLSRLRKTVTIVERWRHSLPGMCEHPIHPERRSGHLQRCLHDSHASAASLLPVTCPETQSRRLCHLHSCVVSSTGMQKGPYSWTGTEWQYIKQLQKQ